MRVCHKSPAPIMSQKFSPDENITPDVTVNKLKSYLDSHELSPDISPSQEYFKCDYCSSKVFHKNNLNVTQYLADNVLNESHPKSQYIHQKRPLIQLATYGQSCSDELLFYPCHGFAEVRTKFTLTED